MIIIFKKCQKYDQISLILNNCRLTITYNWGNILVVICGGVNMPLILFILGLLAFFFYNQITGIILILSGVTLVLFNVIKKIIEIYVDKKYSKNIDMKKR